MPHPVNIPADSRVAAVRRAFTKIFLFIELPEFEESVVMRGRGVSNADADTEVVVALPGEGDALVGQTDRILRTGVKPLHRIRKIEVDIVFPDRDIFRKSYLAGELNLLSGEPEARILRKKSLIALAALPVDQNELNHPRIIGRGKADILEPEHE